MVAQFPGELREIVDGTPLLATGQLGPGDDTGQPGVPRRPARQRQQVQSRRVGLAVLRPGQPEGQLGAEDGGQPQCPGGLTEADHAVHAVVVGHGQRAQPEPGRLLGQLLGLAGAVEEAEVGVAVQFRIVHSGLLPDQLGGLVVRPLIP